MIVTRRLAMSMLLSLAAGAMLGGYLSGSFSSPTSTSAAVGLAAPAGARADSPDSPAADRSAADVVQGVEPAADEATWDEPREPGAATVAGYTDWARRDPASFLTALPDIAAEGNEALVAGDPRGDAIDDTPADPRAVTAVRLASEADPRLALEIAAAIGGDFGATVEAAALEALANLDPESALSYMQDNGRSNRRVAAIAAGFARHDLDAAVDWALNLPEREKPFAISPVVVAVASVDLVRAIDLDLQTFGRYRGRDSEWLLTGLEADQQNPSYAADKLAGIQSTQLLADTMGWWVHRDTFGAIGWVMSQETVSATAIERMARTLTQKDSQSALALAAQFPPAVRARWIETVVGTLADYDPISALDVLAQFEGEPFHAEALSNVAGAITLSLGPETAAELAGSAPGVNTALVIVGNWDDSPRAAEWAIAIEDSPAREYAVDMAVNRWAQTDPGAARSWVAGLQDDDLRAFLTDSLCEADALCVDR